MREFAEIFNLGFNFFHARGGQINKTDFVEDLMSLRMDFSIYEKSKYIMAAIIGLNLANEED
jgi:hypothetical protein